MKRNKVIVGLAAIFLASVLSTQSAVLKVRDGESIQNAIDQANEGDTILVLPGTYEDGIYLDKSNISLVALRGATISPYLNNPIPIGSGSFGISIGGDNVLISGFNAYGYSAAGIAIGGNNVNVLNCHTDTISVGNCSYIRIYDTEASKISMMQSSNVMLFRCKVSGYVIATSCPNMWVSLCEFGWAVTFPEFGTSGRFIRNKVTGPVELVQPSLEFWGAAGNNGRAVVILPRG